MNNEIKDIVDYLEIKEKKKELENNRDRIFKLKCDMSKMTFDRKVGIYAYYLDEIHYLVELIKNGNEKYRKKYFDKIRNINSIIKDMCEDPDIIKYNELRDEYYDLLFNNEYYETINIGLKEELSKLELPLIYVEQSHFDFDKHIITGKGLNPKDENDAIYVEPIYKMESIRDYRHFYNRVNFKYLEGLCEDYSFDLKGKNLGKVRIRNLKRRDL